MDPFISREDLSDYIGSDVTADDKALIAVDSACDMVRLFTEQTINEVTDDTVLLDGTGTDCLLLPQLPVTAATTVIENVGSDAPGTLTLDTDYKVSDNGELYRLPGVIDSSWSAPPYRTFWWPGRRNVSITYSHGYADDDVPRDLRVTALSMAARLYSQTNGNVVFESQGQRSIRYSGPATDWTNTEQLVLRKYRQSR